MNIYLKTKDGYYIPETLGTRGDTFTSIINRPKIYSMPPSDLFPDPKPVYSQRVYKRRGQTKDGIPVFEEQ